MSEDLLSKINPSNCPFPVRKCEWCIVYKYLCEDDSISKYSIELTWEELEDQRLVWLKGRGGAGFYFSYEFEIPLVTYCATRCERSHSECLNCCLKKLGIKSYTKPGEGEFSEYAEFKLPLLVYNAKRDEIVPIKPNSKFWKCRDRTECSDAFCEYYDLCKTLIGNERRPFSL